MSLDKPILDKDTLVAAAIRAPEEDVSPPSSSRAGSFTSTVVTLQVGETATRSIEIDATLPMGEVQELIVGWRDSLRNNIAPCVRAAKQKTGGQYSVELSDCWTPRARLFIVAFVTRTA